MVDLTDAYTALKKADAAGDTEAATKLAQYIKAQSVSGTTTGIKPELGNLEGMPNITQRTFRAPSGMALRNIAEKSGGAGEMYSQIADAVKNGVARLPGSMVDLATLISNISPSTLLGVTPKVEPVGVKTTNELLGLKQTPAQYAPYENIASVVAPSAMGEAAGLVAKGITGGVNALAKYVNPKLMAYLDAAEGKAPEILNWLQGSKEIVPGSQPTVAQAIAAAPVEQQSARFAALQPRGANIPEDARTAYYQRQAQQAAAREASVGQVAGTPMSLQMAEGQRLAKTSPLYEAAREGTAPADTGPVLDKIDTLIAKNPGNPELLTELQKLRKGLTISETAATPELARTNAEEVASSLDGIKAAIGKKENKFMVGQLTDLKDMLVKAVPGMEEAQTAFSQASRPINTMNIGSYLKDVLTGPMEGGAERAGAFAQAFQNAPQTIKRSTGQARFSTLEQAGVPAADIEKLNNIKKDLELAATATKLQKAGSPSTVNVQAPELNFFDKFITVANNVSRILGKRVSDKVATQIAFEMLDPQAAAKVLTQAMAFDKARAARSAAAGRVAPAISQYGTAGAAINALAPPNQNSLAGQ